jgi:hypothetical protein
MAEFLPELTTSQIAATLERLKTQIHSKHPIEEYQCKPFLAPLSF